jgi:hypothetical protein
VKFRNLPSPSRPVNFISRPAGGTGRGETGRCDTASRPSLVSVSIALYLIHFLYC